MPRDNFQSPKEKTSAACAIRASIGRQLRATYAPEVSEPLPQPLLELLRRLSDRDDKKVAC